LPSLDPALVLRGQAYLASAQKRPEQAVNLWAVLARDARSNGHIRAALFAEAKAISLRQATDAANLIKARALLNQAVCCECPYGHQSNSKGNNTEHCVTGGHDELLAWASGALQKPGGIGRQSMAATRAKDQSPPPKARRARCQK
jgi:hypothetical protein